jgi:hypothetical protein
MKFKQWLNEARNPYSKYKNIKIDEYDDEIHIMSLPFTYDMWMRYDKTASGYALGEIDLKYPEYESKFPKLISFHDLDASLKQIDKVMKEINKKIQILQESAKHYDELSKMFDEDEMFRTVDGVEWEWYQFVANSISNAHDTDGANENGTLDQQLTFWGSAAATLESYLESHIEGVQKVGNTWRKTSAI